MKLDFASFRTIRPCTAFLRRLHEAAVARALHEVVHRIPLPGPHRRTQVAVDDAGLGPGALSTFLLRCM
ncbi:MAG: hypothetical protein LAO06_14865 [Acidobacteriia bacterium]|nr:hypothetical protein [Terriglobia bacterium]